MSYLPPVDKLRESCPICGRKSYCQMTEDKLVVLCKRPYNKHNAPTANQYKEFPTSKEGTLFKHVSTIDSSGNSLPIKRTYKPSFSVPEKEPDFTEFAQRAFMRADRSTYSHSLCVSVESLEVFRWGTYGNAATIPMRNPVTMKVIGVRLRAEGAKTARKGSKAGLIMPAGMKPSADPLFVPEGESDACALWDIGIRDIAAKPGRLAGSKYLVDYASEAYRPIIIISDRDRDGYDGAVHTAKNIVGKYKSIKIIMPPPGYNDIRKWKIASKASIKELYKIINNTKEWSL